MAVINVCVCSITVKYWQNRILVELTETYLLLFFSLLEKDSYSRVIQFPGRETLK